MRRLLMVQGLLVALCGVGNAHAGAFGELAYVSDKALDTLRGRYIDAGKIMSFGIEMASTWTGPDGTQRGTAVVMAGTPNLRFTPTITTYSLNGTSNQSGGTGSQGGLTVSNNTVQGVTQVNQIGGNNNNSGNLVNITIRPGDPNSSTQSAPGAGWVPSQGQGVTLSGNKLTSQLDMGDKGSLSQSVGQGQLQQFTRINTNDTVTRNSLNITVTLNPNTINDVRASLANAQHLLVGLPR
ncbi:hypothetical protein QU481_08580 [Crenobacter sp. SG2303]|uniref:Uncharacterized protein n=1 Tax=Crenobacter oryzisoli TaxID=3056844 RepID=A0ABT7XN03_9NEIS|nr:hypothetical protein [Crenobacter sp. SG2303]MDN0074949.1 hypothetical protein [Crenobacter sp. SG2303]